MYKDYRYINAGTNEFYRYGRKAQERLAEALVPNKAGYLSVPADGGKYWTFGTSDGKYGEYVKHNGTFFSVNKGGFAYAKADTEKGEAFIAMINDLLEAMRNADAERIAHLSADCEDDDEEEE